MYGSYVTPSQSAVYIGEYHIDDCYSVDWSYRDNKTPLYNYFDDEVAATSVGKKIVVGTLSINFRFPGYLAYAIDSTTRAVTPSSNIKDATDRGKYFVEQYLDEMKNGTAEERMKLLMGAAVAGPQALNRMSALAYFSQNRVANTRSNGVKKYRFPDVYETQEPELDVLPVDIWTHFGDINKPHVAQVIEGAVFVGQSQQIQAGATAAGGLSASGINVLEVYSFWAKKVSQFRFNGS